MYCALTMSSNFTAAKSRLKHEISHAVRMADPHITRPLISLIAGAANDRVTLDDSTQSRCKHIVICHSAWSHTAKEQQRTT